MEAPEQPRGRAASPGRSFAPSGFFVLRTPLRPLAAWLRLGDDLQAAGAVDRPGALAEAVERDRATLERRLRELAADPEVRDAVFVASPSLDEGLDAWLRGGDDPRGKLQSALLRYFARMAGRATPFGLFSGCSLGGLGDRTRLALAPRAAYERHTRLDTDYLFALTEALGELPEVRRAVRYRPNSSLFRVGGRWRYVKAHVVGQRRDYHLVTADATDYLDATIARARDGATLDALARALVDADPEVRDVDAAGFVDELVAGQILVSPWTPPVTGPEPLHALIADLAALPAGAAAAQVLAEVRDALAAVDRAPPGTSPAVYRDLARRLAALPARVELSRLFQVDLVKPAEATLGPPVVDAFARGVELLHRLQRRPYAGALSRFREAFVRRYEGREVPLVEALDEELGVGFERPSAGAEHAPLLAGLALPAADPEPLSPWGPREQLLLRRLQAAAAAGAPAIDLSDADLAALGGDDPPPLPDAFCAMGTLLAASPEALARGEFRLVFTMMLGPSGARLIGRFCHADPRLQAQVEAHLRAEEACRPDAVFAEVTHLPEGRVGNITCRPVLRDHEIVFLGRSGAAAERQIPVTDLMVSVVGDRVVLRSLRLGREVLPRMTNAHNFAARSLGMYRFLCSLQGQGTTGGLGWHWGALESAPFLPRVTAGRLVLSRARWNLAADELRELAAAGPGAAFAAVARLRAARGLPRRVALQDGDHELPLDLENVRCVEILAHLVKPRTGATLVEMFPDELCAEGPEGRFVHEILLPFVGPPRAPADATPRPAEPVAPARRTFPPGSAWLYAKLYTGTAAADRILVDAVAPVVAQALESGAATRWFFIRYGDPEWHLRLRFHGDPARLHAEVLPALYACAAPLLADGAAWRLQLDTYERETERYGGPEGVELAEQLFHADSDAALELLGVLADADDADDARWRLALCGMDLLLDALGLDLEARLAVAERARRAFAREFRADVALRRALGDKYRQQSRAIARLLERADDDAALAPGLEVLARRSRRLAPVAAALRAAERARRLWPPLADVVPSYLHMSANRLLRAEARAQELVLYDSLARFYASRLARRRA
jgi:thiopeptide-type bacteriocin biosynthesis protein